MKPLNQVFLTFALAAASLPLLAEMRGFTNLTPHTWHLTPDVPPRDEHRTGARSRVNVAVGPKGAGPSGTKYTEVDLRSGEKTRLPIEVPPGTRVQFMTRSWMVEDFPVHFKLWLPADPMKGAEATNVVSIASVAMTLGASGATETLGHVAASFASGTLTESAPAPVSIDRGKDRKDVLVAFDEGFKEAGYCFVQPKEETKEDPWLWNLVEGNDHSSESPAIPGTRDASETKGGKSKSGKCVVQ